MIRPQKRQKRQSTREFAALIEHGSHPYGVRPLGNALFDGEVGDAGARRRNSGLGSIAALSDELLLALLDWCTYTELGRLACTSRALYAFVHCDDVWRDRVYDDFHGDFTFCGRSWKQTYQGCVVKQRLLNSGAVTGAEVGHGTEAQV